MNKKENPYKSESKKTPLFKIYEYIHGGGLIKINRLTFEIKSFVNLGNSFYRGQILSQEILNKNFKFLNYSEK